MALAAVQIALGLAAILDGLREPVVPAPSIPLWVSALHISVLSGTAVLLIRGAERDPRAAWLGATFLAMAASFAYRPLLAVLPRLEGLPQALVGASLALPADAFGPWLTWSFVERFPRALLSARTRRLQSMAVRLCALSALALLAVNGLLWIPGLQARGLELLDHRSQTSHYWTVTQLLTIPALPFALWKARRARAEERRRVGAFLWALVLAGTVVSLAILLGVLSPRFVAFVRSPLGQWTVMPLVQLLMLSIPVATAYAVLVRRAIDVRVLVRQALEYGLARALVSSVAVAPFVALALSLYQLRDQTLSALASSPRALALGACAGAGALAWRTRRGAIDWIDRRFFRERYDARRVLLDVSERCVTAANAAGLARMLRMELDRALHPETLAILIHEPAQARLVPVAGGVRPLDSGSELVARLQGTGALELDLERPGPLLRSLPEDERHWLAEGAFRLLVPLRAAGGALLGAIALGGKRSELAFTHDDELLVRAVAASAASRLEGLRSAGQLALGGRHAPPERAGACTRCGSLFAPGTDLCPVCELELAEAAVPYVLFDKFRFVRRLGEGAMGVVYLAEDLLLRRPVAVKTLPRTSPEGAARLRREARAMAAVAHPNLALIFGIETWEGTPFLVTEYLDGGTLAARLEEGRRSVSETVELGLVLCQVLARIHAAGVLHRDIKPSNIGFAQRDVPKLLDFGVAQMLLGDVPGEAEPAALESAAAGHASLEFAGTPAYMSPEALLAEPADVSFDLWSTGVLLYEALSGVNPFVQKTWTGTLNRIVRADIPDLRERAPDCPAALARLIGDVLHRDRSRRPATAVELLDRLQRAGAGDRQRERMIEVEAL